MFQFFTPAINVRPLNLKFVRATNLCKKRFFSFIHFLIPSPKYYAF